MIEIRYFLAASAWLCYAAYGPQSSLENPRVPLEPVPDMAQGVEWPFEIPIRSNRFQTQDDLRHREGCGPGWRRGKTPRTPVRGLEVLVRVRRARRCPGNRVARCLLFRHPESRRLRAQESFATRREKAGVGRDVGHALRHGEDVPAPWRRLEVRSRGLPGPRSRARVDREIGLSAPDPDTPQRA